MAIHQDIERLVFAKQKRLNQGQIRVFWCHITRCAQSASSQASQPCPSRLAGMSWAGTLLGRREEKDNLASFNLEENLKNRCRSRYTGNTKQPIADSPSLHRFRDPRASDYHAGPCTVIALQPRAVSS